MNKQDELAPATDVIDSGFRMLIPPRDGRYSADDTANSVPLVHRAKRDGWKHEATGRRVAHVWPHWDCHVRALHHNREAL
jgi:hypothetical protein